MDRAVPQLPRPRFCFYRFTIWVRKLPPAEEAASPPAWGVGAGGRAGEGEGRGSQDNAGPGETQTSRGSHRGTAGSIPRVQLCSDSCAHTHARTLNSQLPHPSAIPQQHQSTDRAPKALVFPPNRLRAQNKTEKRRDLGFEANK